MNCEVGAAAGSVGAAVDGVAGVGAVGAAVDGVAGVDAVGAAADGVAGVDACSAKSCALITNANAVSRYRLNMTNSAFAPQRLLKYSGSPWGQGPHTRLTYFARDFLPCGTHWPFDFSRTCQSRMPVYRQRRAVSGLFGCGNPMAWSHDLASHCHQPGLQGRWRSDRRG